jgi:L-fuculose-phosphate aldolase
MTIHATDDRLDLDERLKLDASVDGAADPLQDPRFKVAASRRILYRSGLDSLLGGHVSMRAADGESYWITPIQYFDETLPRDVGRVNFSGDFVAGESPLPRSPGIGFHAAIYEARPEVNCVIHTHAFYLAVLSTSQTTLGVYHDHGALFLDQVAYFQDTPELNAADGAVEIAAALGDKSILLLRNHGSINVSTTIEAATGEAVFLEWVAKHQVASMRAGGVEMNHDTARWYQQAYRKTGVGQLTWEANLRRLRRSDPDLFAAVGIA